MLWGFEIGYEPGAGFAHFFFAADFVEAQQEVGVVVGGLNGLGHQPLG